MSTRRFLPIPPCVSLFSMVGTIAWALAMLAATTAVSTQQDESVAYSYKLAHEATAESYDGTDAFNPWLLLLWTGRGAGVWIQGQV